MNLDIGDVKPNSIGMIGLLNTFLNFIESGNKAESEVIWKEASQTLNNSQMIFGEIDRQDRNKTSIRGIYKFWFLSTYFPNYFKPHFQRIKVKNCRWGIKTK